MNLFEETLKKEPKKIIIQDLILTKRKPKNYKSTLIKKKKNIIINFRNS